LLIASGGDGTVSSVASAAVGKAGISLGILPQGTANSIASHLGVPTDLDQACAVIIGGNERVVDTATVNGRTMLLMATLGVHAEAITETDPEQKRKYGVLAYLMEEASRLVGDSLFEVTLDTGAERFSCRASAVTVANLAPPATIFAQGPASIVDDDGLLDVTLVAFEGLGNALATSLHLATHALAGLPADRENIGFFRAASIRIETAEPKRLMVDGEDAGVTPVEVRSVPRSLQVRVPLVGQP
jgi:YegS/Rv2252/BmrU family lipid kinase